jgi:alkylation response protein AidB-like acyl-CoA dehydrogenase
MYSSQNPLGEALQRFLSERYDSAARRAIVRSEPGWSCSIWNELAELGLLGAFAAEPQGGLGAGPFDLMSLMEVVGRYLLLEPFVSTAVIGGVLFSELENQRTVHEIASGRMRLALASDDQPVDGITSAESADGGFRLTGYKVVVRDAPSATHLIVSAHLNDSAAFGLFLVPSDTALVTLNSYRLIDGTVAANVRLSGATVPKSSLLAMGGPALVLFYKMLNNATVAVCAEAVGVMRAMLEQTIAYTSQRTQFGKPLASFQVLQHRMAEMFVDVEQAYSLTWRAFLAPHDSAVVSAAKIRVNEALRAISHGALQLHGAIGTTDEIELSQYFRRAAAIERQYGSSAEHYARVEQRVLEDINFAGDVAEGCSKGHSLDHDQRYSASV